MMLSPRVRLSLYLHFHISNPQRVGGTVKDKGLSLWFGREVAQSNTNDKQ